MRRLLLSAIVIVAASFPRLAGASTWRIDSAHSSAQFAVRHLMVSTVRGTLGPVVIGDLSMHGVTKEVVLDVEGSPQPFKDPMGNLKLGGSATTKLNRKDFGIEWNKTMDGGGVVLSDTVDVTIDIELIGGK